MIATCEMITIDFLVPCAIVGGIGISIFLLGKAANVILEKIKRKIRRD